ncbi:MAG: sigma-54-dependent Fis family transcriptional regulator [Deltaproteobacteria bacterium]|nr:MAG: sigma-54-dependent Fis family transcriptional regulator [Deltaproteobacteria bacterium]
MKTKNSSQLQKSSQTILVVDDDLHILEVLEARLSSAGYKVIKTGSAQTALHLLQKQSIDMIVSDIKMPEMNGFHLLSQARALRPGLPIILLTAYGSIPDAVKAVKSGAVEYLTKPFQGKELIEKVDAILSSTQRADTSPGKIDLYRGKNPAMKALYEMVQKVAESDVTALILGESGVGKGVLAQQIHELSRRKENPFIVVDCGSTPDSLLESELFGHAKGAFTDAVKEKKGLTEAADKGTLFLDEIGNISAEMQMRMLRFLEERTIRRVGEVREIPVDCRVIAATNANITEEIRAGRFREDLYYRLRVVILHIPPLRERREDIPDLVRLCIKQLLHNSPDTFEIPEETMDWLCRYPWPGNIRELKNALEGSLVLCRSGVLLPEDFHLTDISSQSPAAQTESAAMSLEENEKKTIIKALQQSGGVRTHAADLLGISRRAIHYKIKKYKIVPEEL